MPQIRFRTPNLTRELPGYANPYGAGIVKIACGIDLANFGGTIGRSGTIPGYRTLAVYYQPRDIIVIILTNKFMESPIRSEEIIRDKIFAIILGSACPLNY